MAKREVKVYNAFTKSYRLRYVVHAYKKGSDTTLCGREIFHGSTAPFDEEADGACGKCLQGLKIQRRIHPGWPE